MYNQPPNILPQKFHFETNILLFGCFLRIYIAILQHFATFTTQNNKELTVHEIFNIP